MLKNQSRTAVPDILFLVAVSLSVLLPVCSQANGLQSGTKKASQSHRGLTTPDPEPASAASIGPYYALVIGNNNYKYVNKLQTAVNDAEAVAQMLRERYGFTTKVLRNATRSETLTALYAYRRSPRQSNLLIYYAGHGVKDPRTEKAYWLPVDAASDNDVNWISASTITEEIKAIPSLHVLIISDSCYSGDLTRDAGITFSPSGHEAAMRRLLESPSRTLMSSGGDEPVVDGGADGHSRFASVLLQSLQRMDEDKFAASKMFQKYIQESVAGSTDQIPQYGVIRNSGHAEGDFIFTRKGGVKPLADEPRAAGNVANAAAIHSPAPVDADVPGPAANSPGFAHNAAHAHLDADFNAIAHVLRHYEEAYNQRDAGALWRTWPDATNKTRQDIEKSFKDAKSITMNLTLGTPSISPDGQTAIVKGQMHQVLTPKQGSPQPQDEDITFSLKKNNGIWTIVK